jgi:hypothetical protein
LQPQRGICGLFEEAAPIALLFSIRFSWSRDCPFKVRGQKETATMKRIQLAIATTFLMTAGSLLALAPPRNGQGPAQNPNPQGQQAGNRGGKKTGPQDGSGPIHNPGTGGGTGAGQHRGRK